MRKQFSIQFEGYESVSKTSAFEYVTSILTKFVYWSYVTTFAIYYSLEVKNLD